MKIIAIVQARMGSTRLPGKVLLPLRKSESVLDSVFKRIRRSKLIDEVIIATSTNSEDNQIATYCYEKKYPIERGSSQDVLERYYKIAKARNADVVIRVTGDCPLVDSELSDQLVKFFLNNKLEYAGIDPQTLGLGIATEVIDFNALQSAYKKAIGSHREHVTSYIYNNGHLHRCLRMSAPSVYKDSLKYRLTLDTKEDYRLLQNVFDAFNDEYIVTEQVIEYLNNHKYLSDINNFIEQKTI